MSKFPYFFGLVLGFLVIILMLSGVLKFSLLCFWILVVGTIIHGLAFIPYEKSSKSNDYELLE